MASRHEIFDHTADTGIHAFAPSLDALFEECARAMFEVMYTTADPPVGGLVEVTAAGPSREDLLVAWLSELLFIAETRHLALNVFTVDEIGDGQVRGRTGGRPAGEIELQGPPVKAVTYHGLEVAQDDDAWRATVIFDV